MFLTDFPTIIPAKTYSTSFVYAGENVHDILTILHRFHSVSPTPMTFTSQTWTNVTVTNTVFGANDSPWNLFANWFMFYRGSHNYKLIPAKSATTVPRGLLAVTLGVWDADLAAYVNPANMVNPFTRNGVLIEDTIIKPSIEWSTPYVSTTAFDEVNGLGLFTVEETSSFIYYEVIDGSANTTSTYRLFHSVGDDFTFGCPFGCPVLVYYQP